MTNLIEGLLKEVDRNTELLEAYKSIGPAGAFGTMGITADIKSAKEVIGSGDVVAMLRIYETLKGNK